MSYYIGNYKSDTWVIINKIYLENGEVKINLIDYSNCTFDEVCEQVAKESKMYFGIFEYHRRREKSVYEFYENGKTKMIIKAVKI